VEKNPWVELRVSGGVFEIQITATGYHDFLDFPVLGRNATLGIYENGIPVAPEVNVAFGSRIVQYSYVANETRTFDILISVNDRPEILDVKHMTIYVGPGRNTVAASAGTGREITPGEPVFMPLVLLNGLMVLPSTDIISLV